MSDMEKLADLRASLCWHSDMVIENHFGERVWLRNIPGGITDCCLASQPCDYHCTLTVQAPGTVQ